jgi:phenylalanine-4-hydroxylase
VTEDFKTLQKVLNEFSKSMAFLVGGSAGLEKALQAKTVNTVQLSSGLQVSGILSQFSIGESDGTTVDFIRFTGPCQLSLNDQQLPGHDRQYHAHGFSSPVGELIEFPGQCPSTLSDLQWQTLIKNNLIRLNYKSGIVVEGLVKNKLIRDGRCLILTLQQAWAKKQDLVLFEPSWGDFDLTLGLSVDSVFGGPADALAYGDKTDFVKKVVSSPVLDEVGLQKNNNYQYVRQFREQLNIIDESHKAVADWSKLSELLQQHSQKFSIDWLLLLEIFELAHFYQQSDLEKQAYALLISISQKLPDKKTYIEDGVRLANEL